jgi:hypothetical protein
MIAKRITQIAKQAKPNKHLVMMTKTYKKNAKDDEGNLIGCEFVSGTIRAVDDPPPMVWCTVIPLCLLLLEIGNLVFCINLFASAKNELRIACIIIPTVICAVWLLVGCLIRIDWKLLVNGKWLPLRLITNLEKIFGKPVETWTEDFDPVRLAEDYLKSLAAKVKVAEEEAAATPWNPEKASALRVGFDDALSQIGMILPVNQIRGYYFDETEGATKLPKAAS